MIFWICILSPIIIVIGVWIALAWAMATAKEEKDDEQKQ